MAGSSNVNDWTSGWKGTLTSSVSKIFETTRALAETPEEAKERKTMMLISEVAFKVFALLSGLVGLSILSYSLPAFSLLGVAFGGMFLAASYDSFKISSKLGNDTKLYVGINQLMDSERNYDAEDIKFIRMTLIKSKLDRLFADTVVFKPLNDFVWRAWEGLTSK